MRAKEMNQTELAAAMDTTSAAISNWKTRGMPSDQLEAAAGVLGVSVDQLLGREDEPPEYMGHPRASRRVPVVGTAKMGNDGYFEDFSEMPGAGDGHIEIATEDPNAYCLRVRGQSMFPAIRDNWYVLIEPNGTAREGEYVLLKLRDGRKMVKEFLFRRSGSVEVMSVNGGERMSFDASQLDSMQPVGAVVSPSKWRPE
jgi:phage repressor protein C with HTH and peptisase S24 domain